MHEIPDRTLQVLNPIKTNDRNRTFGGRAKLDI